MSEGDEVKEILKTRPAVPVRGEIVSRLGEINLREDSRFPFREVIPPAIPTFSLVWLSEKQIGKDDFNKAIFKLRQPTRHHARSSEVVLGKETPGLIWSDENGILFGTVNIKGNNLEDPRVEKDRYSSSGFRVFGLQDQVALETIIQASKILRKAGVETEKPELIIKPYELITRGRRVKRVRFSIEDFKKYLIDTARAEAQKPPSTDILLLALLGLDERGVLTMGDLPQLEAYVNNTEFYFIVRGLQVSERLRDLEEAKNEKSLKEILKRAFTFINIREEIEAQRENREPRFIDVDLEKDIEYYFTNYLPCRLAGNIAKIHKVGLVHGFLTSQNLSLAGSIYDLDSIRGEQLGDKPVGSDDIKEDFKKALTDLAELVIRSWNEKAYPERTSYFKRALAEEFIDGFFRNFVETYLDNMTLEFDVSSQVIDLPDYFDPGDISRVKGAIRQGFENSLKKK